MSNITSGSVAVEGRTPRVGMISLGCAKNLIDSEIMLGSAAVRGFEVAMDPEAADVVVVNTCGFIESAKQESIDAILAARTHPSQRLVVAGCLAQRHREELAEALPEVDAFMGLDDVAQAGEFFQRLLSEDQAELPHVRVPRYIPDYDTPRFRLTPTHTTYLKIAEGCNHPCSFCVIPRMRGRHRSRSIESIVLEAQSLVADGVKELNLISQDTTYFGMDHWDAKVGPRQPVESGHGPTLVALLDELGKIEGNFWIRLLYTHPAHWGPELIEAIARNPKVARYIDMPLQHIHGEMLSKMRRETSRQHIEHLIRDLRAGIPGLALRTTFIVGFPGETEEHFESLLDFIRDTRFERLGVFGYSREDGSRAAKMEGHLPEAIRQERLGRAMEEQQRIATELAAAEVGKTISVLADTSTVARTEGDAPEVDCVVHLTSEVSAGEFVPVRIVSSEGYDLIGEPLGGRAKTAD